MGWYQSCIKKQRADEVSIGSLVFRPKPKCNKPGQAVGRQYKLMETISLVDDKVDGIIIVATKRAGRIVLETFRDGTTVWTAPERGE